MRSTSILSRMELTSGSRTMGKHQGVSLRSRVRPRTKTGRRGTPRRAGSRSIIGAAVLALAMIGTTAALGADGSLPGGTSITVDIDDPAGDLTIIVDDEGDTIDLTLTGTASVAGSAAVKNTTLIYILDLSGSMWSGAGVDCTEDGSNDSRLVCQAEAVAFLNELAASPASPVGFTGVGSYSSSGNVYNVDLDPDRAEDRYLVPPDYDGDDNGVPDLEDVVRGLPAGGLTNFSAGLDQALFLLDRSTTPVNRVVYISDGVPNTGGNVNNYAGDFDGYGATRIDTFAITAGSGCDVGSATYGTLDDIATLGTIDGTCTEVEDLSDLSFVLGQILSSELTALTGTINGGEPVALTTVDPELPQEGPATAGFTWDVEGLGVGTHELCVTASGSDGGGEGSVTECRTVTVTTPLPEGLHLAPETAITAVGEEHTVTATLVDGGGDPVADAEVVFTVTDGPHEGTTGSATTDEDGQATFTYEGADVGTDTIVATYTPEEGDELTSNAVTVDWVEVLEEAEEADEVEEAEPAEPVEAEPDFTG